MNDDNPAFTRRPVAAILLGTAWEPELRRALPIRQPHEDPAALLALQTRFREWTSPARKHGQAGPASLPGCTLSQHWLPPWEMTGDGGGAWSRMYPPKYWPPQEGPKIVPPYGRLEPAVGASVIRKNNVALSGTGEGVRSPPAGDSTPRASALGEL